MFHGKIIGKYCTAFGIQEIHQTWAETLYPSLPFSIHQAWSAVFRSLQLLQMATNSNPCRFTIVCIYSLNIVIADEHEHVSPKKQWNYRWPVKWLVKCYSYLHWRVKISWRTVFELLEDVFEERPKLPHWWGLEIQPVGIQPTPQRWQWFKKFYPWRYWNISPVASWPKSSWHQT